MKKEHNNGDSSNALNLQQMMFDQMKRLSDPNADLDKEIKRAQALSSAGTVIINAEKVKIDASRVAHLQNKDSKQKPKMIGNGKGS